MVSLNLNLLFTYIIINISIICIQAQYLPKSVSFTYLGCYNDRKEARDVYEKDYTRITKLNNSVAIVEICVRLCVMANYKYAAIQS